MCVKKPLAAFLAGGVNSQESLAALFYLYGLHSWGCYPADDNRLALKKKGVYMWKNRMRSLRDSIIRHSKIVFPLVIIAAVAVTVMVALRVKNADPKEDGTQSASASDPTATGETGAGEAELTRAVPNDPLELNTDSAMHSLIATYFNALANSDVETIKTISTGLEDTEEIRIQELGKYIETYPSIDIYTKKGPEENSYIVYVDFTVSFDECEGLFPGINSFYVRTDESGQIYIVLGEVDKEVLDYIAEVNFQDDVVELYNRVNVACNELFLSNSKLFDYVKEMESEVNKATGEILAAAQAQQEAGEQPATTPEAGTETPAEGAAEQPPAEQPPVQTGPQYATATTTVNVRSSDSENAEKLGKVAGGTKLEVTEQRANGWSKVVFEEKEGYIKSEYLQLVASGESAEGAVSVGSVTASANVNVRASASETAEKLGVLAGGDSAELIGEEGDWCKIKYGGQVGYVKTEYIQK